MCGFVFAVPKEHFDVAFSMFDLDGDGSVDKAEFCHVIENLLRSITANEAGGPMNISAEGNLVLFCLLPSVEHCTSAAITHLLQRLLFRISRSDVASVDQVLVWSFRYENQGAGTGNRVGFAPQANPKGGIRFVRQAAPHAEEPGGDLGARFRDHANLVL